MAVTSIHIVYGPRRPKPRVGDRKVIGGVEHVRRLKKAYDAFGRPIGYDCTGGRHRYEWAPV